MASKHGYEHRIQEVKKNYGKVQKKYNLPKIEALQKEFLFRIEDISPEPNLIFQSLMYEINKLFGAIARDVSSLLTCGSFCCIHEAKTFSRDEKERSYKLFKNVQKIIWEARVALLTDEEACGKWVNNTWKQWKSIKKEALWLNTKMYDAWAKYKKFEEDLKYVK